MNKIREFAKNPLFMGIAGLVMGLVVGLTVLGWWLFPVQWKDADASYLRQDLKAQYFCMIVDSYKVNQNASLAVARLDSMGITGQNYYSEVNSLQASGCSYGGTDETVVALGAAMAAGPNSLPASTIQTGNLPTSSVSSTTTKPANTSNKSTGILAAVFCLIFLAMGGLILYFLFFRNRKPKEQIPSSSEAHDFDNPLEPDGYAPTNPVRSATKPTTAAGNAGDNPAAHFMTTYVIGNDFYDDSFIIDGPRGEFLGECGVGISLDVGVGEPKKVAAFDIWLFDTQNPQTQTKVLMGSRAMNDNALRQQLATKGELILAEAGQQILLETPALQMQAKVVEMVYGQGAMPAGSYFERLTLELSVWAK